MPFNLSDLIAAWLKAAGHPDVKVRLAPAHTGADYCVWAPDAKAVISQLSTLNPQPA